MKKIILTIVLSSLLPAIAVAKDKIMHNDNPNANTSTPLTTGKHMKNTSPNASALATGKHMGMGDNPFSSHPKDYAKAAQKKSKSNKGYTVIPYKK